MKYQLLFCSFIASFVIVGCKNSDAPRPKVEEEGYDHGDVISFTREQAANVTFAVQEVQPTTFHQVIKTSGQILPATGEEAVIAATSHGIISFASPHLVEGKIVNTGETLFQLSTRSIADGDYYTRTKATHEAARTAFERAEALIKDSIISRQEYEKARLDYETARVSFEAISGRQTATGLSIPSPLTGYLKNIRVKAGEYVTAGQPLATVSHDQRLILRAEVSQKHYPALKQITTANFQTSYDQHVYSLSDLNGRLLSHGKSPDEDSFYIPVSFEFYNREGIIPGTFVEVFLISSPIEDALVIPISALTNEMGSFYVYIQVDDEEYRKQEITLGAGDGKEVQVIRGLQPGDRIVTLGAYQVKLSAGRSIPQGHSH